jgi:hypothetical protein
MKEGKRFCPVKVFLQLAMQPQIAVALLPCSSTVLPSPLDRGGWSTPNATNRGACEISTLRSHICWCFRSGCCSVHQISQKQLTDTLLPNATYCTSVKQALSLQPRTGGNASTHPASFIFTASPRYLQDTFLPPLGSSTLYSV